VSDSQIGQISGLTLDPQGNLFFTSLSGLWELDGPRVAPAPAPAVTVATLAATGTPLSLGTGVGLLLLLLGVVVMTRSCSKAFSSRYHLDARHQAGLSHETHQLPRERYPESGCELDSRW